MFLILLLKERLNLKQNLQKNIVIGYIILLLGTYGV